MNQLGLFGAQDATGTVEPHITSDDRALAERLHPFVRFGTSSWAYPGWNGIVYAGDSDADALSRSGLTAYAQHPLLRAVGIDRSHYKPLREEDLALYSAQIDYAASKNASLPSFRAVSKVWDELTTAVFPQQERYKARAGQRNPHFLDGARFVSEVLEPYRRAFTKHAGPFVFELTPMPIGAMDERTLASKVDAFAAALPSDFEWAFELRNAELLGPRWLDALRANGAAHVFNYWTAMPPLRRQLAAGKHGARFLVMRLMLPPYSRYEAKRAELAPFNRIALPQQDLRDDVVYILRAALDAGCEEAFVLVGNKAEGSAPLTVRALAERIAREI